MKNFGQKCIFELLALLFLSNRFRLNMRENGIFHCQITCTPRRSDYNSIINRPEPRQDFKWEAASSRRSDYNARQDSMPKVVEGQGSTNKQTEKSNDVLPIKNDEHENMVVQSVYSRKPGRLLVHPLRDKEPLLLMHPFRLLVCLPATISGQALLDRNPGHMYSLHHSPHNGEATGFCGEGVNLIGSLSHIAKETFHRIGGTDGAMHHLRKVVKCEEMFFIFHQASYRFRVAFLVFALKRRQMEQRLVFGRCFPNPGQFCRDGGAFALGKSIHHMALFLHDAALTRGSRKKCGNGC